MTNPVQSWWCEGCGSRGAAEYRRHAGVYEVVNAIRDTHRRLAPDCEEPFRIRVGTPPEEPS